MKAYITLICFFSITFSSLAQEGLSREKLEDLTDRAMRQIELFQGYVTDIGAARYSIETRLETVDLCKKLFTQDAVIQEQGKRRKNKKNWTPPEKYLLTMLNRGEVAPVILDFNIVDDLSTDELIKIENPDGTISYKGEIIFKQYYCKLRDSKKLSEATKEDPNVNCSYYDYTDKKVEVEILLYESAKGKFWITLISGIYVIRVYD